MRYPRGTGYGLEKLNSLFGYELEEMPAKGEELEIGKGRIVRRPRATARQKAVILSLGTRLAPSLEAAIQLEVGSVLCLVGCPSFFFPLLFSSSQSTAKAAAPSPAWCSTPPPPPLFHFSPTFLLLLARPPSPRVACVAPAWLTTSYVVHQESKAKYHDLPRFLTFWLT